MRYIQKIILCEVEKEYVFGEDAKNAMYIIQDNKKDLCLTTDYYGMISIDNLYGKFDYSDLINQRCHNCKVYFSYSRQGLEFCVNLVPNIKPNEFRNISNSIISFDYFGHIMFSNVYNAVKLFGLYMKDDSIYYKSIPVYKIINLSKVKSILEEVYYGR